MSTLSTLGKLREAVELSGQRLDAAAQKIELRDDWSDYIGNPGTRSCERGSPQDEAEYAAAKAIESATFECEGCERVTTRSYPRALAEAMAVILRARGMEASVAPDCDDRSQAWLYAYDGAEYEP